ncbi:DUF3536 domain-containing protein [candidate division KSB1 bacterium]|nr:DUF3536 domain-containing protein [candidate division KSB1 bacterium]
MLSSDNIFVTIHGHFYQPPRENPWTEHIEHQPSAAPFHDWNERINHECYHANCFARIMNPRNRLEQIVNNFEYINFNVGPTLMHWIRDNSPETYRAIIDADIHSRDHYDGHGNAIAQVYNHVILPLASDEDKYLQIRWGLDDFRSHFQRPPEAIWLAETAVNQDTIDILVEFGLKYIILSPYQAWRVRELGSSDWKDVSTGNIDSTMPFRQFSRDGRFIDIFFYNHTISSAIGFEHLLTNSYRLVDKFRQFTGNPTRPMLVSACTDGESYGHHEKFGEMCLAHFIKYAAPKSGLELINYGAFLEKYPPTHEVQVKPGPDGEGTAWSCAHGVGRWIRNCGCSDGGYPSWNQHWRTPLRQAFNWLHKTINQQGEKLLSRLITDIRTAKLEYLNVIQHRSEEARTEFLYQHTNSTTLSQEDRILILRFMESWHHCQLMFTSCAWFFADINRLEPVQNLKYAARAIQLVKKYFNFNLEDAFINQLELAKSNDTNAGTGKDIYLRDVKPSIINYKMIVANFAMESCLKKRFDFRKIYGYYIEPVAIEKRKNSNEPIAKGMVWLIDTYTSEKRGYIYFIFMQSLRDVRCYILNNKENFDFNVTTVDKTEEEIKTMAGPYVYSIQNLFIENRDSMIQLAFAEQMKTMTTMLEDVFDKHIDLLETFNATEQPIPFILKAVCEYVYSHRVDQIIEQQARNDKPIDIGPIIEAFRYAKEHHFNIESVSVSKELNTLIKRQFEMLLTEPCDKRADSILRLLDTAEELLLPIDSTEYVIDVYRLIHDYPWHDGIPEGIHQLAHKLNVEIPAFNEVTS